MDDILIQVSLSEHEDASTGEGPQAKGGMVAATPFKPSNNKKHQYNHF
jgi:hypothetical protein